LTNHPIIIPQADPSLRIARFRAEIDEAISQVISSSRYILGTAVEKFEEDFANYIGVKNCIGVASGTDALALSLRGLGVKTGDEVITTALAPSATAQAILHCGATPLFVDVNPISLCIDPTAIEAGVTKKTKAIIPVHLFGQPADMKRVMEIASQNGLIVVEDCAQAHGASIAGCKVGSFGDASAFSFYPTKNLGGIGDSGAIMTNDDELAIRLRRLRNYGMPKDNPISITIGFNSRIDELQAAILSVLLRHLDDGNRERCQLADEYRRELSELDLVLPPSDCGAIYHQFVITCENRDRLSYQLRHQAGIITAVHYNPPLHLHPAFSGTIIKSLPRTEYLTDRLLSLPIQPEVASGKIKIISESLLKAIG
jgi:dTDP-3-amino-3,4,6-trideoxy-alpha-D-glucose transaminase